MLYLKLILVLVVAAALEGFVPQYWSAFSLVDLPLIITVYVALLRDPWLAMFFGCIAGLVGDAVPSGPPLLGAGGFAKTVVGYGIAWVGSKFSLEGPLMRVFVLAGSALVNSFLVFGLLALFDARVGATFSSAELARRIGFETAANIAAGVFVFWALDKLFSEKVAEGQMRVRRRFYE